MSILVCLSSDSTIEPPLGVDVHRRPSDWGIAGSRKRMMLVFRALRLLLQARRYDRVVLVTSGIDLFVLAALLPRKTALCAVDWLIPRSHALDRLSILRRVRFVVVRRSDISTLRRRFGIRHTSFAPLPAPRNVEELQGGDYIYSAGWAHRDWPTLLAALRRTGLPAVISASEELDALPNVKVLQQLSTAQGRERMRASRCVALTFFDNELPAGPLVLLDAMAHGKPIVVSDVGRSRDYVDDECEALVIPPGDVDACATALQRLWDDPALRRRLGTAARTRAQKYTSERFWSEVLYG
jgi:glycosyltransferase involved in cell wall biosynthesis